MERADHDQRPRALERHGQIAMVLERRLRMPERVFDITPRRWSWWWTAGPSGSSA
jgi:hypothetical protein